MNASRGLTLVEVLVYLALYALIIAGALAAVYSMFESGDRDQSIAMLEEEGDFLVGKIDWTLSDAASVRSPVSSGHSLTVVRGDASTISISSSGKNILIQEGNAVPEVLNNTDVAVSNLVFTRTILPGDGIEPESVTVAFTVLATTSDGRPLTRDFVTVKYLRK